MFIPEVEEVEVLSRDGSGIKLNELELEEKRRVSSFPFHVTYSYLILLS